jgi:hypothetical protein
MTETNNTDISNLTTETTNVINTIFNKSNITLVIWFLAIYFVAYFILGFFFKASPSSSNYQANLSRTFDFLMLGLLLIFLVVSYLSSSDASKESMVMTSINEFIKYVNEPTAIISCAGFILIFYLIIYLFRIPMTAGAKSIFIAITEGFLWKTLLCIIIVDFFKYALGQNISDTLVNWLNSIPSTDPNLLRMPVSGNVVVGNTIVGNAIVKRTPANNKEVFNIANNLYTYEDAQAICKSYDSTLATYDQMEQAYADGADWCNYGWSDGQMAFFPTQKSTWQELQKSPSRKNSCGRPGINGGYMQNPNMKYGVNCYGKKPKPTDMDLARMTAKKHQIYPKTQDELRLERRVNFWKENSDKLLKINSYNDYKWSEY